MFITVLFETVLSDKSSNHHKRRCLVSVHFANSAKARTVLMASMFFIFCSCSPLILVGRPAIWGFHGMTRWCGNCTKLQPQKDDDIRKMLFWNNGIELNLFNFFWGVTSPVTCHCGYRPTTSAKFSGRAVWDFSGSKWAVAKGQLWLGMCYHILPFAYATGSTPTIPYFGDEHPFASHFYANRRGFHGSLILIHKSRHG